MIYNTLIIFDTNRIRKTKDQKLDYVDFGFGGDFIDVAKYLKEKKLDKYVTLAVPECVVEELKMQMRRDYKADVKSINEIKGRLDAIKEIIVKDRNDNFDFEKSITESIEKYFTSNGKVVVMEVEKENASEVMKNLKEKAFLNKLPFKNEGNIGFKDALIWENILHGKEIDKFDKIYFFTENKKDFAGCENEFIKKYNKHFKLVFLLEEVETELETIYEDQMKYEDFYIYASTKYFQDIVKDILSDYKIGTSKKRSNVEYKIQNYCEKIEPSSASIDAPGFVESEYEYFNLFTRLKIMTGKKWVDTYLIITIDEFKNVAHSRLEIVK